MTSKEFLEAVALGKSRSDCSSECINLLVERIKRHAESELPGDIVECGSYRCGATIVMAAAAEYYGTRKRVSAFDTWGGLPYGSEQKGFENFADADFDEIVKVTTPFNIALIRGKHETTVPHAADLFKYLQRTVALLFMDSDFYDSHLVCLRSFWPLIPAHGCVMFHDWTFQGVQQAIKDAVDEKEYDRYDLPHNMGMIVKV